MLSGPAGREAWDTFVDENSRARLAHLSGWEAIYRDTLGLETSYLSLERGRKITGILPLAQMRALTGERLLVSLPFLNYAGACAQDDEGARELAEKASSLARERKCRWVELRSAVSAGPGWVERQHKVRDTLDLGMGESALWKGLGSKLRSQVGKAGRNGLASAWGGAELLEDFYGVYLRNMRALGSLPLPRTFFAAVFRTFHDRARVQVVRVAGATVAAAVVLGFREILEVPWAASLPEARPLAPVMLLYWEMIRLAAGEGYRTFDMGRSTPGSGSSRFKQQWGTLTEPLCWRYWVSSGKSLPEFTSGSSFGLARKMWKLLPLALVEGIGTRLISHVPA